MGAMMVWVDGCMDGVDECVDGWDEGLEGMRVWRAILLQWGLIACPPPHGHHDPRLPSPSEGHEVVSWLSGPLRGSRGPLTKHSESPKGPEPVVAERCP